MNIMLSYPNLKWSKWNRRTAWSIHPYNLCLLGAMVEKKHDVEIIDGIMDDLSKENFAEVLIHNKPDILGVSVLTNEYGNAGLTATKIAKEVNPNIKTVMGGVHATSLPEDVMKNPSVDYVVVGEGEHVFPKLCDFIEGKSEIPKGVFYREDGKVKNTGRADFIQNLDEIPYPAYHLIDFMKYATSFQRSSTDSPRAIPYARTVTSRGCPNRCCFCEVATISGKKVRFRSVDNILGELDWLKEDYGIKALQFDDDNLTVNNKRAKDLFKGMIERKYDLKWNAPALALYNLDEEMIALMSESGCQYVDVAMESGIERVLKDVIHKPLNLEYGKKMLETLKKYHIDTAVNFVIGFPGETWNEIRRSLKVAEDIDVDYIKIAIATPLPNTELYNIAKEKGYLEDGFDFNNYLWGRGWIKTDEFTPNDLKVLRTYEWDRINFTNTEKKKNIARMMGVTDKELEEIRKFNLKSVHEI